MSNGNRHDTNRKKEQLSLKKKSGPPKTVICLFGPDEVEFLREKQYKIQYLISSHILTVFCDTVPESYHRDAFTPCKIINLIIQTYYMYRIRKNKIRLQHVFFTSHSSEFPFRLKQWETDS